MANDISATSGYAMQAASTLAGAAIASADSRAGRKYNAEQAQINREYQTAEREAVQQYNLDMWNMSNEWNLAQWHRQNEYDSPKAQLERARQAGINPNTAIGSMYGARSSNASASPVTSTPMSGSSAQYTDGLPSALMSSISELGVQTANMLNTLADKNTKQYWLSYDQMTESQRKKILNRTADNLAKDLDLKDVNIGTAKTVLMNLAEMKEQELLNLREQAKKLEAERHSTYASMIRDSAVAQSTIETNESMQSLNNQLADESEARTEQQSQINEFAKALGYPIGTPEYLLIKDLYDKEKLSEFIDGAYAPLERAKWKPGDRYVPIETQDVDEYKDNQTYGVNVLGTDNGEYYNTDFRKYNYSRRFFEFDEQGNFKTIINP